MASCLSESEKKRERSSGVPPVYSKAYTFRVAQKRQRLASDKKYLESENAPECCSTTEPQSEAKLNNSSSLEVQKRGLLNASSVRLIRSNRAKECCNRKTSSSCIPTDLSVSTGRPQGPELPALHSDLPPCSQESSFPPIRSAQVKILSKPVPSCSATASVESIVVMPLAAPASPSWRAKAGAAPARVRVDKVKNGCRPRRHSCAAVVRVKPEDRCHYMLEVISGYVRGANKFVATADYFRFFKECRHGARVSPNTRRDIANSMLEVGRTVPEPVSDISIHMAINLFDRYMSHIGQLVGHEDLKDKVAETLEVVGAACLFVCSKLEDSNVFQLGDVCRMIDSGSSKRRAEVRAWELDIIKRLSFDLRSTTLLDVLLSEVVGLQDYAGSFPNGAGPVSGSGCVPGNGENSGSPGTHQSSSSKSRSSARTRSFSVGNCGNLQLKKSNDQADVVLTQASSSPNDFHPVIAGRAAGEALTQKGTSMLCGIAASSDHPGKRSTNDQQSPPHHEDYAIQTTPSDVETAIVSTTQQSSNIMKTSLLSEPSPPTFAASFETALARTVGARLPYCSPSYFKKRYRISVTPNDAQNEILANALSIGEIALLHHTTIGVPIHLLALASLLVAITTQRGGQKDVSALPEPARLLLGPDRDKLLGVVRIVAAVIDERHAVIAAAGRDQMEALNIESAATERVSGSSSPTAVNSHVVVDTESNAASRQTLIQKDRPVCLSSPAIEIHNDVGTNCRPSSSDGPTVASKDERDPAGRNSDPVASTSNRKPVGSGLKKKSMLLPYSKLSQPTWAPSIVSKLHTVRATRNIKQFTGFLAVPPPRSNLQKVVSTKQSLPPSIPPPRQPPHHFRLTPQEV